MVDDSGPEDDTHPEDDTLPEGPVGDELPPFDAVDDTPAVTCSRCDREWDLAYELDVRMAGNDAVEQFALDHYQHTGHFPDDVSPWLVDCRHCPEADRFLAERPARRWAETHARHTEHAVELSHDPDGSETVDPEDVAAGEPVE